MGLFETVQRRIVSLGLLPKLINLLPAISIICTFVSIILIGILPIDGQYRNTYISENALMPSQAYSYYRETEWNVLRGYRGEIETMQNMTSDERNNIMASWLQEFGTKTSIYHNEQFDDTLYGVLHAPRGDGTEAIVLVVPWFNADNEFNIGGSALGVSLAKYFSRWPVWSKNIIVVFSENPKSSLRAWVEAYHTSLDLTGGSLEAAVILDYPGTNDFFDYTEIYYEGLNGELPNLDLVNVAVSITQHEGMKVSLNHLPFEELDDNSFSARLKTLLLGIKNSALAGVRKSHGNEAFSGWRIQAITLKACGTTGPIDITTFGRIPEAVFRSVNNLLEKFHQSFFFYLLIAPRNFVSISSYLPSAVILSVAFAISALSTLINNKYASIPLFSSYSLFAAAVFCVTILISYLVSHYFLDVYSPVLLLTASGLLAVLPTFLPTSSILKEPTNYRIRTLGYLYFSLVLTSLLMVNFPLAFIIGLLAYPLTFVRSTSGYSDIRQSIKNTVLLIISNPFMSIWAFSQIFETEFNDLTIFKALISAWKELNCWTWFVLCIGWLPCWLLTTISTLKATPVSLVDKEKKIQ